MFLRHSTRHSLTNETYSAHGPVADTHPSSGLPDPAAVLRGHRLRRLSRPARHAAGVVSRARVAGRGRRPASRINELVAQQREALEKIAQQPGVAALLQRGAPPERSRKQEEIKSQLTGAASVHLLPRNSLGAFSATDGLDPACLDYVRRMAGTNAPAVPEFHSVDSPTGHYDLAVPVRDENRNPVGYLLAGFTRAPLQAILEQSLPPNAYMELQQPIGGRSDANGADSRRGSHRQCRHRDQHARCRPVDTDIPAGGSCRRRSCPETGFFTLP